MQQQGLQDLIMFRDELQQPEPTGIETLGMLRDMTARSMADQQYANMAFGGLVNEMVDPNDAMRYAATGGLVSLPVVQAGFGGFLKKVFKTAAKLPGMKVLGKAVVRPLSKSRVGRFALSAAPFVLSGGNPALAAAIAAGIKIAGDPEQEGNPYKVLQSAGKAYAGSKLGQAMKGTPSAEGTSKYGGDTFTRPSYQPGSTTVGAPPPMAPPPAETSFFADVGKSITDSGYDPEGTVFSRLGERIAGTGQFEGVGAREQLGLQPSTEGTGSLSTDKTGLRTFGEGGQETIMGAGGEQVKQTFTERLAESMPGSGVDKPGFLLGRELSNVPVVGNLIPESAAGQLALGSAGLQLLGAGQQEIPQEQLNTAGLRRRVVETDFGKQKVVYEDEEGNPIDYKTALQMIQQAAQSFGEGGERRASGVRLGFERVNPDSNFQGASPEQLAQTIGQSIFSKSGGMVDPVLRQSGGLIGMAYGGMPANDMSSNGLDVRYKEFSGMVGGQGSGMQDNVYMPIVERENGQQVATLAVSPKEYVVDANTMSLLGNGNPDEGAEIMDETVKDIRMAATGQKQQQKEIDGLAALDRMRRSV